MRNVTVNKNDANQRLDKFLTKFVKNMPQSAIYKYIRKKRVKVYNSYDKLGDRYDSAKEEEKQYEMYKHS